MSRSLFQLEPMKCEQVLKLDVKNSIVNCNKGCTKPMAVRDSQQVNSCINASLATEHGSTHSKKVTSDVPTGNCTQKSLNVLQSDICAMKTTKTDGGSKKIVCSQLELAGTQNLSNVASIDIKRHIGTSFSRIAKYPIENGVTHSGHFANDVRKRKRAEDISNESKTSNLTLCKKQKLDFAHVDNSSKAQIPKIYNPPFNIDNKRSQAVLQSGKRNMKNNCQLDTCNEINMKSKRTGISDNCSKTQKCKPSLIPAVIKPQLGCKWIECKVNHPIKQSKSKIPLLIHQLGSKNESNLAAHMKRIGAYKSLSFHQKNHTQLKRLGVKEIGIKVTKFS